MEGLSIYSFPHKHIARCLFGNDNPTSLRRVDALLDGESKMTVDILYVLHKMEPLLNLELSLKDMYAKYELAEWRKAKRRHLAESGEQEVRGAGSEQEQVPPTP